MITYPSNSNIGLLFFLFEKFHQSNFIVRCVYKITWSNNCLEIGCYIRVPIISYSCARVHPKGPWIDVVVVEQWDPVLPPLLLLLLPLWWYSFVHCLSLSLSLDLSTTLWDVCTKHSKWWNRYPLSSLLLLLFHFVLADSESNQMSKKEKRNTRMQRSHNPLLVFSFYLNFKLPLPPPPPAPSGWQIDFSPTTLRIKSTAVAYGYSTVQSDQRKEGRRKEGRGEAGSKVMQTDTLELNCVGISKPKVGRALNEAITLPMLPMLPSLWEIGKGRGEEKDDSNVIT